MKNPWEVLTKKNGKYYLKMDENAIFPIKSKLSLKHLPEPFVGNRHAPIYFLNANPGAGEVKYGKHLKGTIKNNLSHNPDPDYPFYHLNPKYKNKEGAIWWHERLDPLIKLIKQYKIDPKILAKNFFSVELCGYQAKDFNNKVLKIPSNYYSVSLVKKAMKHKKLILIGYGVKNWFVKIPKLKEYNNCYFVAKNRKMRLSETTLSPALIKKIRKKLYEK